MAQKLIDMMNAKKGTPWISLEYFPPRTDAGVTNLYDRIERMKEVRERPRAQSWRPCGRAIARARARCHAPGPRAAARVVHGSNARAGRRLVHPRLCFHTLQLTDRVCLRSAGVFRATSIVSYGRVAGCR